MSVECPADEAHRGRILLGFINPSKTVHQVPMLKIDFNGNEETIGESETILDLLKRAGVEAKFCAVEVNLEILPKSEYSSYRLREGDRIEVVTLVGGG